MIVSIRGSERRVAGFKSESRPASLRNRWPASYWNAWPASSESAFEQRFYDRGSDKLVDLGQAEMAAHEIGERGPFEPFPVRSRKPLPVVRRRQP
jgi:hypothetical protein